MEKPRSRSGSGLLKDDFDEQLWRDRFPSEPYTVDSDNFDDYAPAYRLGTKLRSEIDDFDLHEADLRQQWDQSRGSSKLDWNLAKDAVRSAWEADDISNREDDKT